MLTRLYVHNYRTFVNFEWKLPQVSALVGENGSGKSAILEILWLLREFVARGVKFEETGFPATRTAWLQDTDQVVEADVQVGEDSFRYRVEYGPKKLSEELSSAGSVLYRAHEGTVELFGDQPTGKPRASFPYDRRRSYLALLEARPDNRRIMAFRKFVENIWIISPDAPRIRGSASNDDADVLLLPNLENLAEWYRVASPEDPGSLLTVQNDLKKALVGFEQIRFDKRELVARFAFKETKAFEVAWTALSDGQRLLVGLYAVLRFGLKTASIIGIDEADNYIAAPEIEAWLRQLLEVVLDNDAQLVVSTHHPEAIDFLSSHAAWRMWRDPAAGHTRIDKLEPDLDLGEKASDVVRYHGPNP
jgi:predicted ATPase